MRLFKLADAVKAAYNPFDRKPRVINFSVIESCNARCIMCNIWKSNDGSSLSPESLEALAQPFFDHVSHVGLSGGEPFLRDDLDQIVEALSSALPRMRSISITSHGFNVERIRRELPILKKICDEKRLSLSINFSVDGDSRAHELQRRVPGGFAKTIESIDIATRCDVPISLQFTATRRNVYTMPYIADLARELNTSVTFRLATEIARLDNRGQDADYLLTEGQISFFADFITSDNTMRSSSLGKRLFYRKLATQILSIERKRTNPCIFQKNGVFISGHGRIHPCSVGGDAVGDITTVNQLNTDIISKAQRTLVREVCNNCVHDQSGIHSPKEYLTEWIDRKFGIRHVFTRVSLAAKLLPALRSPHFAPLKTEALSLDARILAIGQYGGEHVGDAAILGGVLNNESIVGRKIDVLSIRTDRTRMWLSDLKNSEAVNVVSLKEAITNISKYDLILYAGGPIMDLPSILGMHLSLLNRRNKDTPFIITGAGYLEIKSKLSLFLVRRLLQSAAAITVRSERSKVDLYHHYGINSTVIEDPAITYLKSVYGSHPKKGPDAVKKCLINLRPLWNRYIGSNANVDLGEARVRLLNVISEAVNSITASYLGEVYFEFIAFNADQFGMSDFEMGIELSRKLKKNTQFSVNYREFGVEELARTVSQFDFAICMRLHACAFTLTRGIPTLGIEYASGFGKVAQLFSEQNSSGSCFNFQEISVQDVVDFVEKNLSHSVPLPSDISYGSQGEEGEFLV
ncbi:MAG: polysaccharide pyruvyl transferase family protein [Verrucomicrobiota bacterium]|nr:polysaccharide pyruvyl transferase family protein [Verrucomicrobiota bacterium]